MKEIFIERQENLLRIAIKQNDVLKECFIEEETNEPYPGEIYKGVVKNIVPAIKCAFIDIGHKKNVYMYMDRKFKNTSLKKGQELLVQVVKEDLGSKGAKVTNIINFPGRYCVLETINNDINFSKKIESKEFKENLCRELHKPKDIGVMIRTAALDIPVEEINEEIEILYSSYTEIMSKYSYSNKLGILFNGGGILGRVLRDKLNEGNFKIYVNKQEDFNYIEDYLEKTIKNTLPLKLHDEDRTLFDYYGIEREVLSLRNRKVPLNCGGYIIIDKTEAMYVIDVNSGKNVKSNSIEKTAYITNYQAAEEIVRQIRLRNLSGIILIDFIDMNIEENKEKILHKIRQGFLDDKNKTVIYPFTELNLLQIARRRVGKSIYEYIEEDCGICMGKGKRVRLDYLCMLISNEIIRINEQRDIKDIHIEMDESYKKDIEGDILNFVKNIDALDKNIYLSYFSDEHFKVEPLIFLTQIDNLKKLKVYDCNSIN